MARPNDFIDDVTGQYIDLPPAGELPMVVRIQVEPAPEHGAPITLPSPKLSPLLTAVAQLRFPALEVTACTWQRLEAATPEALAVAFACVKAQRCVGLAGGTEEPTAEEITMALVEADAGRLLLDAKERTVLEARLATLAPAPAPAPTPEGA